MRPWVGLMIVGGAVLGAVLRHAEGSGSAYVPVHPQLSARSAVVLDAGSGNLLFTKRLYAHIPPASTTKVMTALVALERLPLNTQVLISPYAASMPKSKAGLTRGARYSAADLIVASLVSSSNDAAVALAEAAAGTEHEFTKLMNEKARKIGMEYTRFTTATGLPDKKGRQYSTAYDLALLMREAARNPRIDLILGVKRTSIRGSDGKAIELLAHNKLLFTQPGRIKGKTGWTIASKHTFIGTNYDARKTFVFSLLSSDKPWTDIQRLSELGFALTERN